MIGDFLDKYTYAYLLQSLLDKVPNDVDKREGSVIYIALAPIAMELAQAYIDLKGILLQSNVQYAEKEYLDFKVAEASISRVPAKAATRIGTFKFSDGTPFNVPLESRFNTINTEAPLVYRVIRKRGEGSFILVCETAGVVGNEYIGDIVPILGISGLAEAKLGIVENEGADIETDTALRARYFIKQADDAYGGNIKDYRTKILGSELFSVGSVQIYPVWQGGGTVKVVILTPSMQPASSALIETVQEAIDPVPNQQQGLGIAPIGHRVTVGTATELTIDLEMDVQIAGGADINIVTQQVIIVVNEYFDVIKSTWGNPSPTNVYASTVIRSQIIARCLNEIQDLINITNIELNGADLDISLTQSSTLQQIPLLGDVTLNG